MIKHYRSSKSTNSEWSCCTCVISGILVAYDECFKRQIPDYRSLMCAVRFQAQNFGRKGVFCSSFLTEVVMVGGIRVLEISGQRGTGSGCLFFSFPLWGSTSESASSTPTALTDTSLTETHIYTFKHTNICTSLWSYLKLGEQTCILFFFFFKHFSCAVPVSHMGKWLCHCF